MKKTIRNINDRIGRRFRGFCASIPSGTRIFLIVLVVTVFGVVNIHTFFKAINHIGREGKKRESMEQPAVTPESGLREYEGQGGLQKEMEDFFNEHFKPIENDTTTKE